MFSRIPFNRVDWPTSSFLIGTLFLSLTAVPAYIWFFGIDWFQIGLFSVMFFACGFSITLGYHRLYSHLSFQAHWIVRLLTLIFGAGAFENSVLLWTCACHRLQTIAQQLAQRKAKQLEVTRAMLSELRNEIRAATSSIRLPARGAI
jgi:fatty-acid desaturase